MAYQFITYEVRDRVAIVTMNRPDRLNAWTTAMGREKGQALAAANADPDVGAIVLTGAGRGFCAGADVRDTLGAESLTRDGSGAIDRRGEPDWITLVREGKPMVAAVNGAAVGMGLTMILPCDYIVASEAAKFKMAFVQVGVVPELASSYYLSARVGFGRASDLCLSARMVEATEAKAINLVEEVVPAADLLDRALDKARSFAAHSPLALRHTKALLDANVAERDVRQVQARERVAFEQCAASPEHKAYIAGFLDKKVPA